MSRYHKTDTLSSGELVALNAVLSKFYTDPGKADQYKRAAVRRAWDKVTNAMQRGARLTLTTTERDHLVRIGKDALKKGALDSAVESNLVSALSKLGAQNAVALAA